jgi:pimeloyl-ACP methyl ester carboxylesterase
MVGIDNYPPPVSPLRGCVNDITAMEELLNARVVDEETRLDVVTLKNEQATRQAVIDGFLTHLRKAGPQDVALFYYSGHGSQERTPREFWHLEPDRLDETLVCYDSRPDNYDLADKELSKLIAEVAKSGAHVLIILDSCHSGSGTRAVATVGVRRVPTDLRERPLNTFIVTPDEATALAAKGSQQDLASGASSAWVKLPQGKHIIMAACRDDEEAKEVHFGGQPRGVFSYYLIESLTRGDASQTYRDIFKRVNAMVRTSAARQSPLIEAAESQELDQPFFGGVIQPRPAYFTASFTQSDGWVIDGGAIHGIPAVAGDETTILALFPFEIGLGQLSDPQAAIGLARVTSRQPTRSRISIELGDKEPDPQQTYKAIITATPLAPLAVEIADVPDADLVRVALSKAGPQGGPSLLVHESSSGARFRLIATEDGYRILRTTDERPLVVDIKGANKDGAHQAVLQLEHIARWQRIAELANPGTKLKTSDVQMEILLMPEPGSPDDAEPRVVDLASQGSELHLGYRYVSNHTGENGEWEAPEFKVRLKNNSQRRLYCMLIDLTETFGVFSSLLPGGGVWLNPGEEAYAYNGEAISATVPDDLWEMGLGEIKDVLKLIASTEECDATLLDQEDLKVILAGKKDVKRIEPRSTLERLMARVNTRHIGVAGKRDKMADWITSELCITTARPLRSAPLPSAGKQLSLAPQVTLVGHPYLKAEVRLTTLPQASRAARLDAAREGGELPRLPRLLTDDPNMVRPLQFVATRGGQPGPSVLELTNVDSSTVASVTPDQPLVVRIDGSLVADDEHVMAVGYDREFYLPLGRASRVGNEVEVTIERLPDPLIDSRSLTGSIRIFFQKVFSEKLGFKFDYPLLAIAESDGEDGVKYNTDPLELRSRVAAAKRVLLYVHGIIGDTRGMASSAYSSDVMARPPLELLSGRYDLVLTFDYENLHTSIKQNAQLLKSRLSEAGLGAGHGKTFHIVAHSMGGLVSRWFIEQEGGNQVVQHLVMLGTPNAGSPWSTIEDWAVTALSLGLNGLSAIAWPARLLGGLVSAIEKIDVTLDEMNPKSGFLSTLAQSHDPGVAYTVIAGNTSLITPAETEPQGRLARLLSRLKPKRVLHAGTSLAFFGQPNDIAASVTSIENLPGGRSPEPKSTQVACDHITYFSTEAGLRALAEALD